ncbi:LysM peptidoglycan-binding domain-containing protein [Fluviispira vulneris]|uniref:LysM peptidoglycan-binding domain-containing protein n=1 Tax=Fluviispira vulneris TaxID=2763012 RepID=UPI0016478925|nr:LysM domain-containing protein [Fluviispira vulneris]
MFISNQFQSKRNSRNFFDHSCDNLYTVRRGDSLHSIARRNYGDEKYWEDIWINNLFPYGKYPDPFYKPILTPALLIEGSTLYIPNRSKIVNESDKYNLLGRRKIPLNFDPIIDANIAYSINKYMKEKQLEQETKSTNDLTRNSHDDYNSDVINPVFSFNLGAIEGKSSVIVTRFGICHTKLTFQRGTLTVQRTGNYPNAANMIVSKKDINLQLKMEAEGVLKEFMQEIRLNFSGDLKSPKGEIYFGNFKLSADSQNNIGLSLIHKEKLYGFNVTCELTAGFPIGNLYSLKGSVKIDKEIGNITLEEINYNAFLYKAGIEVEFFYKKEENDSHNDPKFLFQRAYEIYANFSQQELSANYREKLKLTIAEGIAPLNSIPNGDILQVLPPDSVSGELRIKAIIDYQNKENMKFLLNRKRQLVSAFPSHSNLCFINPMDDLRFLKSLHVQGGVPFSVWFFSQFPSGKKVNEQGINLETNEREEIFYSLQLILSLVWRYGKNSPLIGALTFETAAM